MKPSEAEALAYDFCEFINFKEDDGDARNRTRFMALGLKVGAIDLDWHERSREASNRKRGAAVAESTQQDKFLKLREQHKSIVTFVNWLLERQDASLQIELEMRCDFSWSGSYSFEIQQPATDDETVVAAVYDIGGAMAMKGEPVCKFDLPKCLVNFIIALNGRPTNSLRRCPRCEEVFFNSSRRDMIFCNPKCQNSAAVARSRGKKEG